MKTMKRVTNLLLILFISAISFGAFTSCKEQKKDPGEKIEEGIDEIGDGLEEAGEDVKDAAKDAKEKIKEKAKEAEENVEEAIDTLKQ